MTGSLQVMSTGIKPKGAPKGFRSTGKNNQNSKKLDADCGDSNCDGFGDCDCSSDCDCQSDCACQGPD